MYVDNGDSEMSGEFKLYKIKPGQFRFQLLAINGDIILTSDLYTSKLGCTKGIESVRNNASNPDNFVREPTSNGGHRFSLLSLNGRVLGTSPNYQTASACDISIVNIARLARGASVEE